MSYNGNIFNANLVPHSLTETSLFIILFRAVGELMVATYNHSLIYYLVMANLKTRKLKLVQNVKEISLPSFLCKCVLRQFIFFLETWPNMTCGNMDSLLR